MTYKAHRHYRVAIQVRDTLLTTTKGKKYVYKYLNDAPPYFFSDERKGLELLASSKFFKTPHVYLTTESSILMSYVKI